MKPDWPVIAARLAFIFGLALMAVAVAAVAAFVIVVFASQVSP